MFESPEAKFAIHAVRQAALLVRQVQDECTTQALTKEDHSPVTLADFSSQALVARRLAKEFPSDPLVAEESAEILLRDENQGLLRQVTEFVGRFASDSSPDLVCQWIDVGRADPSERFWTLDPLDGTKGFLRGDQYAVALALVERGRVDIGVLGCPQLTNGHITQPGGPGSLVAAVRGQGTWTTPLSGEDDWKRLRVSTRCDPSEARLLRSFESAHTNSVQTDVFARDLGISGGPVGMDSQAKYAVLAAGAGDILIRLLSPDRPNYREKIWDQAAGGLVVEEAGGRVSDVSGKPLDFGAGRTLASNQGVLATNGSLHQRALVVLEQIAGS